MKIWRVKRRRPRPPEPGDGLAKAGLALMGAGFAFAWLMERMTPPNLAPRPELAAPILAGVALLYIGLIVNRWSMGPSRERNGRRLRGAGSGKLPEPVRGWRRLGVGLLVLGIGGLSFLLAQRSGTYGAWVMSGAAAAAGSFILLRLRATAPSGRPRAN